MLAPRRIRRIRASLVTPRRECAAARRGMCVTATDAAGPSSNADAPDRTDVNRLEHVDADHPKHRTAPDRFDTDRACLLIRGFRVRAPDAPPAKTSLVDLVSWGECLVPGTPPTSPRERGIRSREVTASPSRWNQIDE